jgi:hypothetical protein
MCGCDLISGNGIEHTLIVPYQLESTPQMWPFIRLSDQQQCHPAAWLHALNEAELPAAFGMIVNGLREPAFGYQHAARGHGAHCSMLCGLSTDPYGWPWTYILGRKRLIVAWSM